MLRKKDSKPLHHKKSKARKQREQEYFSESEEETLTETQSEYIRPAHRRRKRYDYSEFEDGHSYGNQSKYSMNEMYTTENSVYNMEHDVDEYTSQMSMYNEPRQRRNKGHLKMYEQSEMEFSDGSDTECKFCSKGGNRNRHESETFVEMDNYTSEYEYQRPKNIKSSQKKHKLKINESEMYTDTEPSPPRQDVHHVYLAEQPVGHRAFTYKPKDKKGQNADYESSSVDESEVPIREKIVNPLNKSQYQVYVADAPQDPTRVFNQGPRERILSVTNYDGGVPIVALRDKKTDGLVKTDSGIVYLPVMVLDQGVKLPKNKVVSPESLLKNPGDETHKPLETNVQIYAAMGTNQGNLFHKTQNQSNVEQNKALFAQENPKIAISQTNERNPMKSIISEAPVDHMPDLNETDYPVQKSYINVVPPRPLSPKSTISNFKRLFSTTSKDKTKCKKEKKKKDKKAAGNESESFQSLPITDVDSPESKLEGPQLADRNQSIYTSTNTRKSAVDAKNADRIGSMVDSMMGNSLPPIIGQGIEETRIKTSLLNETKKSILGEKESNIKEIKKSLRDPPQSVTNEKKKSILGEPRESKAQENKSLDERKSVVNEKKKSILGQPLERKSDVIQSSVVKRQSVINEKEKSNNRQSIRIGNEIKKSIIEETAQNQNIVEGTSSIYGVQPSIFGAKPSIFGGKPSISGNKQNAGRGKQSISGGNRYGLDEQKQTREDLWKSEPNIQPTKDFSKLSPLVSEPINKTETKGLHTEKKSLGSRIFGRKKKELTIDEDITIIPEPKKKDFDEDTNELFHREQTNENNDYAPMPTLSVTDQTRSKALKKRSSKLLKKTLVKKKAENQKNLQVSKLWDYNTIFTDYIFLSVKSFLGLSLHDLLMETSHNYTH